MKGCHECYHLYRGSDDDCYRSWWDCDKRQPKTIAEENKFMKDMQRDEYRDRYKRCFVPIKEITDDE